MSQPDAVFEPGSTDYVYAEITNNGQPAATIPTLIEMAFVPEGQTLAPDTATWYTGAADTDGRHAILRIGAFEAGNVLAPGTYDMYVRLTAGAIRPVIPSGTVQIQ